MQHSARTRAGARQVAHTEVTLDDLWSLDLARLDSWRCVRANTAGEDAFRGRLLRLGGGGPWGCRGGERERVSVYAGVCGGIWQERALVECI